MFHSFEVYNVPLHPYMGARPGQSPVDEIDWLGSRKRLRLVFLIRLFVEQCETIRSVDLDEVNLILVTQCSQLMFRDIIVHEDVTMGCRCRLLN